MTVAQLEHPVVALTGATGFVGRHILERLLQAGFRVRALVRQPSKFGPPDPRVETVTGDLADRRTLETLVADAASVVHCAGLTRGVTRAQFDQVNTTGAADCARIAENAGVPRFLLISSLAAREPGISPYAASKRSGENAVLEKAGAMSATIFRPPAVYGPGDREMLPLWRMMGRGLAPVFGSPEARFSLIFVEDLANAVVAWQKCGTLPWTTFELDDGQIGGYGWREVCDTVSSITGRPVRQIRLPAPTLALPAAFASAAGLVTPFKPMLSLGKLRELRHADWVCRPEAGVGIPGWSPECRLFEGLLKTPGWRKQAPGAT